MSKIDYKKEYDRLKGALTEINEQLGLFKIYKDRFHILLDNIDDFVWFLNEKLDFVYVSKAVQKNLGYKESEFMKMDVVDIAHPDSKPIIEKAFEKRKKGNAGNTKNTWEICLKHKNGNWIWLETITTPLYDKDNTFEGIIGVSRDITLKKKQEDKVRESEASLKAQFDNTLDSIWSVDKNLCLKTINSSFYNQYKNAFGIELCLGSNALEGLPEPYKMTWSKRYQRALDGENFSVTDHFEFGGKPQFVEVNFNPIKVDGDIVGVAVFSRDITQSKNFEQRLLEKEANQNALLENTNARIWSFDADLKLILSNSNYIRDYKTAFGYTLKPGDYALNQAPEQVVLKWKQRYQRALKGEEFSITDEFSYEGIHQYAKTSFKPIKANNKIIGVTCYSQDITPQIQNEMLLLNNEKRFRFLSNSSIDLLKLNSPEEILKYVSGSLSKKLPNNIIAALIYNEKSKSSRIVHVAGLSKKTQNALNHAFNKNIFTIKFPSSSFVVNKHLTGKLNKMSGGLPELLKECEPTIADKIIKTVKSTYAYTIGIRQGEHLFATLYFVGTQNKHIEDVGFIESYINLVSLIFNQKQLVESLFESEEKFRKIIENTNSAISIQTKQKILLVNNAWENITGYSRNEAFSLSPVNLVHPQSKQRIIDFFNDVFEGESISDGFEFHLTTRQGNEKFIDVSVSVIEFDGQKAALIVGADITEKKTAEKQLKKFSAGIMNSPLSIVITDIEGNIEYVNPYLCEFTGYSIDEIVGKNSRIFKSGNMPKKTYKELWDTVMLGEVWNGELQNKKKDGTLIWESVRIAPIFDEEDIITHFVGIKEDITERKRNQELIEQSENDLREINAQKDRFFSIIAHDLRSPFSAVVQLSAMLKDSFKDLPKDRAQLFIDQMSDTSGRVFQLIENLLEWAHSQSGKIEFHPEALPLYKLADETAQFVEVSANQKQITIQNQINESETIWGDKNMIHTIIRNLLSNAVKYSPKNGKIIITAGKIFRREQKFILISVQDFGVGIPQDKIDNLFRIDKQYTTLGTEQEKGTGLGLILCQEFVEKHNGEIWVESEQNKGSKFSFIIPVR